MLELRDGARFAHEPLGELWRRRETQIEHFHRDVTAQGFVSHAEDRGESTFAQQGADSKFVSESLLQARAEPGEIQRHGGRKT